MPLMTQITRNGEPRAIQWSWWHLMCVRDAIEAETGDSERPFSSEPYVFRVSHQFSEFEYRIWSDVKTLDKEVFDIAAGDSFSAWRS